jgi:hypothetical protein
MSIGDDDGGAGRGPDRDGDLAHALRRTFARHAGDIESGPAWPVSESARPKAHRSTGPIPVRRWLLPAAAAAVVMALVVTAITVRGTGSPATDASPGPVPQASSESRVQGVPGTSGTAAEGTTADQSATGSDGTASGTPSQRPIPTGMQAVDALGVEIFVPADLPVDATCADFGVARPVPQLGAKCAPPLEPVGGTTAQNAADVQPAVRIARATDPGVRFDSTIACEPTPVLDGETGCLTVAVAAGPAYRPVGVTAVWPTHDVALQIQAGTDGEQLARQIVDSAHWVPVDRNGCAATRSPMQPPDLDQQTNPAVAPVAVAGAVLPEDPTAMSICWYLGNRLGASALLGVKAAEAVSAAANRGAPKWPAPEPQPDLPSCQIVAEHDGVLLTSRTAGGQTVDAVATLAACDGKLVVTNGGWAVLVTDQLISMIRSAADFGQGFMADYTYVPPSDAPPSVTPSATSTPSSGPPITTTGGTSHIASSSIAGTGLAAPASEDPGFSVTHAVTSSSSSAGLDVPAGTPVAPAVPAGTRAVDALGVEIFVPDDLAVDPPCAGQSVSRPAYGLTYAIGCVPVQMPAIWIGTAAGPASWLDPPDPDCGNSVRLEGEAGCLSVPPPEPNSDPETGSATIVWLQHDVAITAQFVATQRAKTLAVLESAHWVPVDRYGCAATRSPVVPANAAGGSDGPVLPADATTIDACWYSGGRLVASATMGGSDPAGALANPELGPAPGITVTPPYTPSPDGPACSDLGRTDGVVFLARRPDGSVAESAAQFGDCTGGQYWTDGVHSQPVDQALASAVQSLTGFLLMLGYHAPTTG